MNYSLQVQALDVEVLWFKTIKSNKIQSEQVNYSLQVQALDVEVLWFKTIKSNKKIKG